MAGTIDFILGKLFANGKEVAMKDNLVADNDLVVHDDIKELNIKTHVPTLLNGWVNNGGYKDALIVKRLDMVTISLMVKSGVMAKPIAVLPIGWRPTDTMICSGVSNSKLARVDIYSNGEMIPRLGDNTWVAINLTFSIK